jgi:hypothetical protein
MARHPLRPVLVVLAAVLAVTVPASAAPGCPFCVDQRGPTLLGDYGQAAFVLVGTFQNAKLDANSGLEGGTTDFHIEEVLKQNAVVAGKRVITLPKYVPPTKSKFVLFCDVYKGLIDPYRGVEVQPKSDLVKYLKGALPLKDRPIADRLRYCFYFLNSPELEVSLDAYREFAKAGYDDYQALAKTLPADTIAGWLRDPKTPPYRFGLYASLLGHCGGMKDAALLLQMVQDPAKQKSSGIDGMLAGYLMLLSKEGQTKEGLGFLRTQLADAKQDFLVRYAALRTARWFWFSRPDVFSKKDLADSVALLLHQPDMADFAVEDLGKWGRWEMTDRVLDLLTKESHNAPVIHRAILRFALRCPEKRAKDYVEQERSRDREAVMDLEELLRLEQPAPAEKAKK